MKSYGAAVCKIVGSSMNEMVSTKINFDINNRGAHKST